MSYTEDDTLQLSIEESKKRALEFIKSLPDIYPEEKFGVFDEIIKDNTDYDPIQVTVEVSPYWGSLDEIDGGDGMFEYGEDDEDTPFDDIPLLKEDLVVRVISRDFGSMISDTEQYYKYDKELDKLVTLW